MFSKVASKLHASETFFVLVHLYILSLYLYQSISVHHSIKIVSLFVFLFNQWTGQQLHTVTFVTVFLLPTIFHRQVSSSSFSSWTMRGSMHTGNSNKNNNNNNYNKTNMTVKSKSNNFQIPNPWVLGFLHDSWWCPCAQTHSS